MTSTLLQLILSGSLQVHGLDIALPGVEVGMGKDCGVSRDLSHARLKS